MSGDHADMVDVWRRAAVFEVSALVLAAAFLTACASGPHVRTLPGKDKTLDQFHADDGACRGWAAQQSRAASGWPYDMAYLQCMYAMGHQIPVTGGPQPTYRSRSDVPNLPAASESAPAAPSPGQPR